MSMKRWQVRILGKMQMQLSRRDAGGKARCFRLVTFTCLSHKKYVHKTIFYLPRKQQQLKQRNNKNKQE
jgi:hypothetical protein